MGKISPTNGSTVELTPIPFVRRIIGHTADHTAYPTTNSTSGPNRASTSIISNQTDRTGHGSVSIGSARARIETKSGHQPRTQTGVVVTISILAVFALLYVLYARCWGDAGSYEVDQYADDEWKDTPTNSSPRV